MLATTTQIRPSCVAEMRAHAMPLFEQHWAEVATDKKAMVLAPDWGKYEGIENAGMLLALAAWDCDHLVGYSAGFVQHHLHYQDLLYYQNDVLFVAQSHRHTGAGGKLVVATRKEAKLRGCTKLTWHVKNGSAAHQMFAKSKRYAIQDVIYMESA
jgi:predicted GNAT superfamily acetyltransferase